MDQIQIALIAIAMVLSAVFLPMMFFGGSTGCHLPPVLRDDRFGDGPVGVHRPDAEPLARRTCFGAATERSRRRWSAERRPRSPTRSSAARIKFNDGFQRLIDWYVEHVSEVVDRKWLFLGIFAGVCGVLILLFVRLPTGFIPTEDQGAVDGAVSPAARRNARPHQEVQLAIENYFLNGPEKKNVGNISRSPAAARG